jgi:hypothetical protein
MTFADIHDAIEHAGVFGVITAAGPVILTRINAEIVNIEMKNGFGRPAYRRDTLARLMFLKDLDGFFEATGAELKRDLS